MPNAKGYVLDTSAILTLRQNEAGAEVVEKILRSAGTKQPVYVCFITLMEYFYILSQVEGEESARLAYAQLKQLPLAIVDSNEQLGLMAAQFKASARLSVADAWIAATAEQQQAILVHKDPEFEQLKVHISLKPLPYK